MYVIYEQRPRYCYSVQPTYNDYYSALIRYRQERELERLRQEQIQLERLRRRAYLEKQRRIRAAHEALYLSMVPTLIAEFNIPIHEHEIPIDGPEAEREAEKMEIDQKEEEQIEVEQPEVPAPFRVPIMDYNEPIVHKEVEQKEEPIQKQQSFIVPIIDHNEQEPQLVSNEVKKDEDTESQKSGLSMIEMLRQREDDVIIEPITAKVPVAKDTKDENKNDWVNV